MQSFQVLRLTDRETLRHGATNVGFGLSYVLPVILALLLNALHD